LPPQRPRHIRVLHGEALYLRLRTGCFAVYDENGNKFDITGVFTRIFEDYEQIAKRLECEKRKRGIRYQMSNVC
ncbi:MAG: hypothetical protein LBB22_03655, partial [Treponema sp.]|nr:hypothetical protein [Treponema sp.]